MISNMSLAIFHSVFTKVMLYEDFAKSQAKREVEDCLEDQEKGGKKEGATQPTTHIFQVCVFESLPIKEGGRERIHCTLSQCKKIY